MLYGKSILIVDRDPLMREILSDSLTLMNAFPVEAGGILEALEILATDPIDLVVSEDLLAPGTGLELLTRIKDCGLELPFALMTGSEPDLDKEGAFAAGVSVIFEKPFGLDRFLEALRILSASTQKPSESFLSR
jgi:DNA-binding NtrC family response regulator